MLFGQLKGILVIFDKVPSTINIPTHEILQQVDKICLSDEMHPKQQLCRLFKYLVNETVEGREEKLKGFTIALEVFNKDRDFDPEQDPIVRIHAGRLRRILKMYYMDAGKNDLIKIEIPKGRYIPMFFSNDLRTEEEPIKSESQESFLVEPNIAILPFKNLTSNPNDNYLALGISEELSVELTKFDDLVVFGSLPFADAKLSDSEKKEFIKIRGIRFIIEGSVYHIGNKIKVLAKLTDTSKEEQIWAERFIMEQTSGNLAEIQENIAYEISCILGSEYGIILNRLSQESRRIKPKSFDTFSAILRFHYFEANQTEEAAAQAFASLKQALSREPNSGIATAMLASMYGNRYMLDIQIQENAYEQFGILAERAYKLDPNSMTVRIILCFKYFAYNKKDQFFREADKCLSMNPNSPLRLGALGQYLALYGDWKRGKNILDQVMNMNVSIPLFLFGATTLYYYRLKEYDKALFEAIQYDVPSVFWGPLLRTAVLGQLNKPSEAESNIAHLKQLKPDFEEKAHYLISRYIKEEDLVEHVIDGLRKAGMDV